jgi:hypothetical protein
MIPDPMRRLRATNPVPELPPLTPITVVMPGWLGAGDRDNGSAAGAVPPRRSPTRWARAGNLLVPALSVAVALIVAVIALTTIHSAHRSAQPVATGHAGTYSNPEGWSVSYPAGFTVTAPRSGTQLTLTTQVTLTSFTPARTLTGRLKPLQPQSFSDAPYTMPLDRTGRFPADGVALILQPFRGGYLGPDSSFPIDVDQFGPARAQPFYTKTIVAHDGIPPARSGTIVAYSQEVTATALVGPKASPAVRGELAAVIKSLAFRRLSPGTQVGDGYIIGPASRFPVGSFTRIEVRSFGAKATPAYLVHAPGRFTVGHQCPKTGSCTPTGAFYGMGETYNTRLDHAPNCQIQFDRDDEQFYCTNLGVRWDRVGRVVKQPADEKYIGGIGGDYAKVTWDGQIMIIGGWGPQQSRGAVHLLWPGWHQPKHPNTL